MIRRALNLLKKKECAEQTRIDNVYDSLNPLRFRESYSKDLNIIHEELYSNDNKTLHSIFCIYNDRFSDSLKILSTLPKNEESLNSINLKTLQLYNILLESELDSIASKLENNNESKNPSCIIKKVLLQHNSSLLSISNSQLDNKSSNSKKLKRT